MSLTLPVNESEDVAGTAAVKIENQSVTTNSGGIRGTVVRGENSYGVKGVNLDTSRYGAGAKGEHVGDGIGVLGTCEGSSGTGVSGSNTNLSGTGSPIGVHGHVADQTNGLAGYFEGKVEVTRELTKAGGGFKIDHPLEPDTKYLYHSFVESPDMICFYSGTEDLNQDGEVEVKLDDWFEALNKEVRFQLTAIGKPAPGLHIAQEIEDNKFRIAGGEPGMRVCWQVTGIRNDFYAQRYRLPVEEDKGIFTGKFLHPELYDRGPESGISVFEEHRQREISYEITKKSLDELRFEDVPEEILSPLKAIEGQRITGTSEFLKLLKSTIGRKKAIRYQLLILEYARWHRKKRHHDLTGQP